MLRDERTWNDNVRDYWDTIADKFPQMRPPIRPNKEETQFVIDSLENVPKGDWISLGATFENVKGGVENEFKLYVADFSENMRLYLERMCKQNIPQKYHNKIQIIDSEWIDFVNLWNKNFEEKQTMKYYTLKNTLTKHSGKKCKVVTGDGSLAFIEGPTECKRLLRGIRNIIDDDGVVILRVGVHEPEEYEQPRINTPLDLVKRTEVIQQKYKDEPEKLKIEKERINREFCYTVFRAPPKYTVDYGAFNNTVDRWTSIEIISKKEGELIKKPLAKLGDFKPYVPDKKDIEAMFKNTGFSIKKGPRDIVNCHMLSYCLTPA